MGLASTNGNKEKEPLWVDSGDKYHTPKPTRPFVMWCACSSIKPRVQVILDQDELRDIDKEKLTLSRDLQLFVEYNHLKDVVPSLRHGTFAVMYNPKTGSALDLLDQSRTVQDLKQLAYKLWKGKI